MNARLKYLTGLLASLREELDREVALVDAGRVKISMIAEISADILAISALVEDEKRSLAVAQALELELQL